MDDTDSRQGGCTTSLADPLLALFPELRPAGAPRLVRLNPNVPWKTRGNGAIALAFEGDLPLAEALDRAARFVEETSQRAEGTSPGVVVSGAPLPPWLYEAAVTRVVARDELPLDGALAWGGRGVIGAAAAIAWPAQRATWERIAYRRETTARREVDPRALRAVEERFPSLFDTYDLVEDDVVCVPSSPCPVLWGLRGESPEDLARASATLGPQRPVRETLFLTNQGTDDHLRDGTTGDARPYASLRVRGRIADAPVEHNGRVTVTLRDAHGTLRCAAYAPTRSFRALVTRLAAGDDVTMCGGIHTGPDGAPTLGIEKMRVHHAGARRAGNPACGCGDRMKSAGRAAGFRCPTCGARASEPRTRSAGIEGWHEVPASARRHLAMPLKRLRVALVCAGTRFGWGEASPPAKAR